MEAVEWTKKSSFGLEQRGWLSRNSSMCGQVSSGFFLDIPFHRTLIEDMFVASKAEYKTIKSLA
jgi:hypothetical protein